MRSQASRKAGWWWVAAVLASMLAGCDAPFLARAPRPGELRGKWLVNGSASVEVGVDCPLVAQLQVSNGSRRRVRMAAVWPVLEGQPELKWKAYRKLPDTLEAGASWEGVWLLMDRLAAGRYVVQAEGSAGIAPAAAGVEVRNGKLPAPVRAQHHCIAARLTGEVEQVVKMLTREVEAGLTPPSTHLQLAELLASLGEAEAARRQYGLFAERVYGHGPLPGWLRSKLDPSDPG